MHYYTNISLLRPSPQGVSTSNNELGTALISVSTLVRIFT